MTIRSPLRRFLRNPLALGGLVVLVALAALAVLAPLISPYAPEAVAPREMLQAPTLQHPFGTDDIGRDVLSRMLHAGRVSLALAVGVAALSVTLGVVLGALSGFYGRWLDRAISAVIDMVLALPFIGVVMVIGAFLELNTWRLVLLLSAFSWQTVARMVRGQVLSVREWPFVEAARASGATDWRILIKHIIPATWAPVSVAATLLVAQAILIESALSFLGFGVRPPTATWGNMLNAAQVYLREAPWLGIYPGLAITLTVASANFVGESLRSSFDPRLRGR